MPAGALQAPCSRPRALSALKVQRPGTAQQVLSGARRLCGAQALRAAGGPHPVLRKVRSWQFAEGASDCA